MNGKLTRLKIIAFKDADMLIPVGTYVVQVNPESYSIGYKIEYGADSQPSGSSGEKQNFNKTRPEEIGFQILFDNTGVLEPPAVSMQLVSRKAGVVGDVQLFKLLTLDFAGDIHRPRNLLLNWGTLVFPCVLVNLDIEYKLFDSGGIPKRAVAKATFRRSEPDWLREAKEQLNSPDLTHTRTVKAGDTLPALCAEIYGATGLYSKVARFNGLDTLMNLKEGTNLYFPPITELN